MPDSRVTLVTIIDATCGQCGVSCPMEFRQTFAAERTDDRISVPVPQQDVETVSKCTACFATVRLGLLHIRTEDPQP